MADVKDPALAKSQVSALLDLAQVENGTASSMVLMTSAPQPVQPEIPIPNEQVAMPRGAPASGPTAQEELQGIVDQLNRLEESWLHIGDVMMRTGELIRDFSLKYPQPTIDNSLIPGYKKLMEHGQLMSTWIRDVQQGEVDEPDPTLKARSPEPSFEGVQNERLSARPQPAEEPERKKSNADSLTTPLKNGRHRRSLVSDRRDHSADSQASSAPRRIDNDRKSTTADNSSLAKPFSRANPDQPDEEEAPEFLGARSVAKPPERKRRRDSMEVSRAPMNHSRGRSLQEIRQGGTGRDQFDVYADPDTHSPNYTPNKRTKMMPPSGYANTPHTGHGYGHGYEYGSSHEVESRAQSSQALHSHGRPNGNQINAVGPNQMPPSRSFLPPTPRSFTEHLEPRQDDTGLEDGFYRNSFGQIWQIKNGQAQQVQPQQMYWSKVG